MYVYRKGNVSNYAMYLEIDVDRTIVEDIDDPHWRQSASVNNFDLIGDKFTEYIHDGDTPIYQKIPHVSELPVRRDCLVEGCNETFNGFINICPKHSQIVGERIEESCNTPEHTGLSVNYYDVIIPANSHTNPAHNEPKGITVSCNDIIEALNMNYACANVFKAIWRICAAKNGMEKKGNNTKYDAEKAVFFSKRVLTQESDSD